MRWRYRRVRLLVIIVGFCWFSSLIALHRSATDEKSGTDVKASVRIHSKPTRVICGQHQTEIEGGRKCRRRFKYLQKNWKENPCFSEFDEIDECSLYRHLVYVERVCPEPNDSSTFFSAYLVQPSESHRFVGKAVVKKSLEELHEKFAECGKVCSWMQQRIKRLEEGWIDTGKRIQVNVSASKPSIRPKLRVLLHMGLLTKEVGLNFGEAAMFGGPLGELVQWSDLAAGLHILGHDVILSWSPDQLEKVMRGRGGACEGARKFDLVYTDIVGLVQISQLLGSLYHYRCLLRILDVYGTEPEFNHPLYNPQKRNPRTWGGRGLDTAQFLTHFPHSPDNSFLGFVVEQPEAISTPTSQKKVALLYGKKASLLKGKERFLRSLHRYFDEIHATMHQKDDASANWDLPNFLINHQNLPQNQFLRLLQTSHLYVGLGRPVEGPAALEAGASGVIFLNPRFDPPREVADGKPTKRVLTSQNPYAESVGEPLVYTVNLHNQKELNKTLEKILKAPRPKPHIPFEFTFEGFLQRLNAYVERQDFCSEALRTTVDSNKVFWKKSEKEWPAVRHLEARLGKQGESCTHACSRHKMVCERTYFKHLNSSSSFEKQEIFCRTTRVSSPRQELYLAKETGHDVTVTCHSPSLDPEIGECLLQSDDMLYSCACAPPSGVQRICPCRKFRFEQIALCEDGV